jgi:hypothetical protein
MQGIVIDLYYLKSMVFYGPEWDSMEKLRNSNIPNKDKEIAKIWDTLLTKVSKKVANTLSEYNIECLKEYIEKFLTCNTRDQFLVNLCNIMNFGEKNGLVIKTWEDPVEKAWV